MILLTWHRCIITWLVNKIYLSSFESGFVFLSKLHSDLKSVKCSLNSITIVVPDNQVVV